MTEPGYGEMRASNADRERAIDVLKAAFAEGRLDQDEYTDRVGLVQESRTYGELAALTSDLPHGPLGTLPHQAPPHQALQPPPTQARPAYYPQAGTGGWLAPPYPPLPPREPLALASLLTGIFLAAFPGGQVLALVLGVTALARIQRTGRRGAGMAIIGTALGALGTLLLVAYIVSR